MSITTALFGRRLRVVRDRPWSHSRVMGADDLERWSGKPEHRQANNGMGMCNTGARWSGACCLGGIGCNVDHAWIGFHRGGDDET